MISLCILFYLINWINLVQKLKKKNFNNYLTRTYLVNQMIKWLSQCILLYIHAILCCIVVFLLGALSPTIKERSVKLKKVGELYLWQTLRGTSHICVVHSLDIFWPGCLKSTAKLFLPIDVEICFLQCDYKEQIKVVVCLSNTAVTTVGQSQKTFN